MTKHNISCKASWSNTRCCMSRQSQKCVHETVGHNALSWVSTPKMPSSCQKTWLWIELNGESGFSGWMPLTTYYIKPGRLKCSNMFKPFDHATPGFIATTAPVARSRAPEPLRTAVESRLQPEISTELSVPSQRGGTVTCRDQTLVYLYGSVQLVATVHVASKHLISLDITWLLWRHRVLVAWNYNL